ncbi:unnamed protein product, partial [Laminaria digitata]
MRRLSSSDDGMEHHYVNPMNADISSVGAGLPAAPTTTRKVANPGIEGKGDGLPKETSKGAFAKLLRRFAVLRRRWRQSRRDKEPTGCRGNGSGGVGGGGGGSSGSGNTTTAGHSRPASGTSWPDNSDGQEFLSENDHAEGG